LTVLPSSVTAKVGATTTIGASANTGTNTMSAMELNLTYDPTAIQVVSFTPGTILPVVLKSETHASGNISVILGVKPTAPFRGTGHWELGK